MSFAGVIGCPDCGTRQKLPAPAPATLVRCVACAGTLERTHGRSLTAALACVCATLLLLIPANLAMFLRTDALGVSRSSRLASSAWVMLRDGWPWLALVVLMFVVVFPLLRFGLLAAVLGAMELDRRPRWAGPAFLWANRLQTWAMPDVFLLGLAVAYARLSDSIAVRVGTGAFAFIAAGLLALVVRATLDKTAVWERIAPDVAPADPAHAIECPGCELLVAPAREGKACPRCSAKILRRKPQSLSRTIALTFAALLLYIPANIYPLATLPINFKPTTYTVLEGVIDLAHAKLWDLALLVFCASFLIDRAVQRMLAQGYRAHLGQSPPLVGAHVITLAAAKGAAPGHLLPGTPYPVLPAADDGGADLMDTAGQILAKVNAMPLARIGENVRRLTGNLAAITGSPQVRDGIAHLDATLRQLDRITAEVQPQIGPIMTKLNQTADELHGTAAAARTVLSGEGAAQDRSLPDAIEQLDGAARSIRALTDYLGRHPEALIRGKAREKK